MVRRYGRGADAEVARTITHESKWCPDTIGYSDARWTGGSGMGSGTWYRERRPVAITPVTTEVAAS